jgi:hypothetical protein
LKVSVIIPVVRLAKALRCVDLIHQNSGLPNEDFEVLVETDIDRIGCPKMVKRLVDKSQGEMVCFLGDDTLPQENFLRYGLEVMGTFPEGWGLVGFNDGTGRPLPTHWLGHKKLLEHLDGEFFHTGYKHCYCDNELQLRCELMGRYKHAPDVMVLHEHPYVMKSGEMDADYSRVYSKEYIDHDRALYEKRKKNKFSLAT